MAKRKSRKKKTSRAGRKGRVGALNFKNKQDMDLIMLAGGTLLGGVAKRLGDTLIAKQAQTTGVSIKQGTVDTIEILGGGALFYLMDSPFIKGLGLGLAGATVYTMTANLRLAGIGQSTALVPFQPRPNVNGVTRTANVAGANAYNFPSPSNVGRVRQYAGHLR